MQNIRTFIAIQIPGDLKAEFAELLAEARKICPAIRWVKPKSIHITLNFLGEISPAAVQRAFAAVESGIDGFSAFRLETGSTGAFPNFKRPRVYWLGLQPENVDKLQEMQKRITDELAKVGFPKDEKKFKPHLTIGRVRDVRNISHINSFLKNYAFPKRGIPVTTVLVMKSILTGSGPVYSAQKAYSLKGQDD